MLKLSLNLPVYRLHLQLVKRRGASLAEPLLPNLATIQNTRAGNKFSRFFRHVFEHKNLKRIFGTNLALMIVATQFLPTVPALTLAEETVISEGEVSLTTEKAVQYPVEKIRITQGFSFFHPAIDLDGVTGDEIKPIKAGVVEAISNSKYAYGKAILINHGNGYASLYAHLSKINVFESQEVGLTTKIGEMGASGNARGDHLHLEVHKDGIPINPFSVLSFPASPVI
jgi:murein DD-endopeptidase MepM/ murein hydrolase activator NlpD